MQKKKVKNKLIKEESKIEFILILLNLSIINLNVKITSCRLKRNPRALRNSKTKKTTEESYQSANS